MKEANYFKNCYVLIQISYHVYLSRHLDAKKALFCAIKGCFSFNVNISVISLEELHDPKKSTETWS